VADEGRLPAHQEIGLNDCLLPARIEGLSQRAISLRLERLSLRKQCLDPPFAKFIFSEKFVGLFTDVKRKICASRTKYN
jgi:hypothetical protein